MTYPLKVGIPTTIELNPISNVNPGDSLAIQGTLKTKSDGTGIDGKTVTLTVGPSAESTTTPGVPPYSAITGDDGTFTFEDVGPLGQLALWDIQANFGGDSEYGPSEYEVNYAEGIPQMQVPDAVLGERANEKPAETKLPIPGPNDLPPCKSVSDYSDPRGQI